MVESPIERVLKKNVQKLINDIGHGLEEDEINNITHAFEKYVAHSDRKKEYLLETLHSIAEELDSYLD